MANENELKVIFGADGKPLEKTLQELEADLKDFQKQLNNVSGGTAIADLNKRLQETKANIANIKSFGLSKELDRIKPSAGNASTALINLSRVAQDAPYGFIGIANNLDPLLLSFQELRKQSGSTGGALKLLAGSLVGAGGVALGLSVVTSLITVAIQKYGSLGKAFAAVVGDISKAKVEQDAFNRALAEASGSVAGEIAQLNSLVKIARNESLSRNARLEAIQQLNKEYPLFNHNLTLENINTKAVAQSIDTVTSALIRQAKIRATVEAIAKKSTELDLLATQNPGEFASAWDFLAGTITGFGNAGKAAMEVTARGTEKANQKAQQLQNTIATLQASLTKMLETDAEQGTLYTKPFKQPKVEKLKSLDLLFYKMNEQAGKMWQQLIDDAEHQSDRYFDSLIKNLSDQNKIRKAQDALKGINEQIRLGLSGLSPQGPFTTPQDPTLPLLEKRYQLLQKLKALGQTPVDVSYLSDIGAQNLLLNEQLGQTIKKLQSIGPIVQEFLAPAFSQFFQSVLSGTETVGQALKSFFKNLIVQIISTIAQAAALAAIMSAITGGGFGAMFKGFLGGGGPNLAGLVTGGQSMDINVSGMLRGSDIFLSGSRGAASLGRRGPI